MAVRRVRRILRRIDPWTVLKVAFVFDTIVALVFVLGSWVTWSMALRRGIPGRVVEIFESLTFTITIEGELYFRIMVLLAIIGAILMTAFVTLGAVLYNLIADLVGGIEIAVLEETYRPIATRTRISSVSEASPAMVAQAASPVPASPARGRAEPAPAPDHLEEPNSLLVAPTAGEAVRKSTVRSAAEVAGLAVREGVDPKARPLVTESEKKSGSVQEDEMSNLRAD